MAYSTTVGTRYISYGWNTELRLEINTTENKQGNYSDVSWAVVFAGSGKPDSANNIYVNGKWGLRVNQHVEWTDWRSNWCPNGGSQVQSSGSCRVYHDGNGNASIPVYFRATLFYFSGWGPEYEFNLSLPHIDRSPASLGLSVANVTTSSITYRITNNYPARFTFNSAEYSINNYNSSREITVSNLNPNTYYWKSITSVTNTTNNVTTQPNTQVWTHTNGTPAQTVKKFSCRAEQRLIALTLPNISSGSYISAYYQYYINTSASGTKTWISVNSDHTIYNLNYHTNYYIGVKLVSTYYSNNNLTTSIIDLGSLGPITTKYRSPEFQANLANTGVGKQLRATATIISTTGCQNAYNYQINYKVNGTIVKTFPYSTTYDASRSLIWDGIAGQKYTIEIAARDSNGQISVRDAASVVCGLESAPTLTSAVTLTPYIDTLAISGISYELFSEGSLIAELYSGSKLLQTISKNQLSIGTGNFSGSYSNLTPNSQYNIKITVKDNSNHTTDRTYTFMTYPQVPALTGEEIVLIGKAKAKKFQVKWEPVLTRDYSSNLTYDVSLKQNTTSIVSTNTQQKDYLFETLTPETEYIVTITPKNGYVYNAEDILTYTLTVKTDADTWLKLHQNSETGDLFNRYKLFLINATYPSGLEIKKPGTKVIK